MSRTFQLCCAFAALIFAVGCSSPGSTVHEAQQQSKGFVQKLQEVVAAKNTAEAKTTCDTVLAKKSLSDADHRAFETVCARCAAGEWDAAKNNLGRMAGTVKDVK